MKQPEGKVIVYNSQESTSRRMFWKRLAGIVITGHLLVWKQKLPQIRNRKPKLWGMQNIIWALRNGPGMNKIVGRAPSATTLYRGMTQYVPIVERRDLSDCSR